MDRLASEASIALVLALPIRLSDRCRRVTETNEGAITRPVSAQETVDWDALYREHAPALLRYLRRMTRSSEEAEALMQDTFVRAIRARRTPSLAGELRTWLYRIATNVAVDHLRRQRRWRFVPFAGDEPGAIPPSDEVEAVRRALRVISAEQATALVLRLHEGFAPREIAAMLGITETAVKFRLIRGRRAFMEAYSRIGGRV